MTETQQRFLKAIAERLGERRLVEVRLFPSIRQGQHESGVAVVAVEEPPPSSEPASPDAASLVPQEPEGASDADTGSSPDATPLVTQEPARASTADTGSSYGDRPVVDDASPTAATAALKQAAIPRLSILTARFRLTLKGPDRGKWDFSMVHDADAPLRTVETVVRGVARRVGDDGEPELLSPEAFARVLSEPWWSATA